MLTSAIRYKEDELGHELSDDEVREVAAQRGQEAHRADRGVPTRPDATELAAKEEAEREVLVAYAPEQLSDEAVDALVDEAIAATGADLDARRWARSWAS